MRSPCRTKATLSSLILCALLLSCAPAGRSGEESAVRISAAASLTDALGEIALNYSRERGVPVQISFTSSSTGARQIAEGMESSIFLSANEKWVDYLEGIYAEGSKDVILRNRLVVAAPAGSAHSIRDLSDLADGRYGPIAMGDPSHVPAGMYGKSALLKAGLWRNVESRVVGALDVRAALSLAAESAVQLALVYRSDAMAESRTRILYELGDDESPEVNYYGCLIQDTPEAREFYDYLRGSEASAVFARYGFLPPAGEDGS